MNVYIYSSSIYIHNISSYPSVVLSQKINDSVGETVYVYDDVDNVCVPHLCKNEDCYSLKRIRSRI